MAHQVLGGGGADVDMVSGQPKGSVPHPREQKAVARYREAVHKALDLSQELRAGSPVVRLLAERLRSRMLELVRQDEKCQATLEVISALRHELEVAPVLAEEEMRRIMGPQLSQFLEESEAAPE